MLQIAANAQMQLLFLFDNVDNQYYKLRHTRRQRPYRRTRGPHFRRTEMAVYQHVIDSAVDKKRHHRKVEGDFHHLHAAQRGQQNLGDSKKEIGKADNGKIAYALTDDALLCRKNPHRLARENTDKRKQQYREMCIRDRYQAKSGQSSPPLSA